MSQWIAARVRHGLMLLVFGGLSMCAAVAVAAGAPQANQSPAAGFDHAITNLSVDFTDTSSDSDGSVASWSWDFGDNYSAGVRNPHHSYATGGTYTVKLTVTDDGGASDSYQSTITVPNAVPTAGFAHVITGMNVDFTDSSADSDGSIASWAWDFGDGTGTSTTASPSYIYAAAGTYTVTLTVVDNDGASDSQQITITVPNAVPTAGFTSAVNGMAVAFSDSSSDSDGNVVAWSWDFGDGDSTSVPNPSHSYAVAGSYNVTLTVIDDDGASDSFQATVVVPNQAPTAQFGFTVSGMLAVFNDSSSDSDGDIMSWSWDFGDGNSASGSSPSYTYAVAGSYTVTLTVSDDDGASDSYQATVSVPNSPPTAAFSQAATGLSVAFTDASGDSDGDVVAWSWDFGDGNGSSAQMPTHTYTAAGSYVVVLTVTDDDGATAQSQFTVQVPNQPPSADFSYALAGLTVDFSDISTDSDGGVVARSWDFGDSYASSAGSPSHTYAAAGSYNVTLTVTDDDGARSHISKAVEVMSGPPVAAITPTALVGSAPVGHSLTRTLTISNSGHSELVYSISRAGASQVTSDPAAVRRTVADSRLWQAADASVSLLRTARAPTAVAAAPARPSAALAPRLDDGSYEAALALDGGGAAIYLNRFTPPATIGAFTIDTLSVVWPSQSHGRLVGKVARLLAYYDADGDGNPANARFLGQSLVTIERVDAVSTYAVSFDVPGRGDVYVGFESYWAETQPSSGLAQAALDTTRVHGRSRVFAMADGSQPDFRHLGNNADVAALSGRDIAGNFLIRATGTLQGGPTASCSNPTWVPWLSVNPGLGTIAANASAAVAVSLDATGMLPGRYSALLCVSTNDPDHQTLEVPVQMTVTGCGGNANQIFANGFDGPPICNFVVTGNINGAVIQGDALGLAFDFVTGEIHPWSSLRVDDVNFFDLGNGQLYAYWFGDQVASRSIGGAVNSTVDLRVLSSGDTVGPGAVFSDNLQPMSQWFSGGSGYLGVAFWNEKTGELNYGYIHLETTAPSGFPVQLLDYGYDKSGASITIP